MDHPYFFFKPKKENTKKTKYETTRVASTDGLLALLQTVFCIAPVFFQAGKHVAASNGKKIGFDSKVVGIYIVPPPF